MHDSTTKDEQMKSLLKYNTLRKPLIPRTRRAHSRHYSSECVLIAT